MNWNFVAIMHVATPLPSLFLAAVLSTCITSIDTGAKAAATFQVLYSFTGDNGDCTPVAGLYLDAAGNLYGTTAGGICNGAGWNGTVFKLAPDGKETVLHVFEGGADGASPDGNLAVDSNGNLYGPTLGGGSNGCGVIFKVTPDGNESTFHTFAGSPTDSCLSSALIAAKDGNLYGTSSGGGKYGNGAIFKLGHTGNVGLLHSFNISRKGVLPFGGIVADDELNLYGTTAYGGRAGNFGTVFEFAASRAYAVLYKFKGAPHDGSGPQGSMLLDQLGNLDGILTNGGDSGCESDEGCGAVFSLAPDGAELITHFFTGKHGDGGNPVAGLIMDNSGSLYGTTRFGGGTCALEAAYGCGTVFEIAPGGTETTLYSFSKNNGANGAFPLASLIFDGSGNLYGTTSEGGQYGYGTVFEITP